MALTSLQELVGASKSLGNITDSGETKIETIMKAYADEQGWITDVPGTQWADSNCGISEVNGTWMKSSKSSDKGRWYNTKNPTTVYIRFALANNETPEGDTYTQDTWVLYVDSAAAFISAPAVSDSTLESISWSAVGTGDIPIFVRQAGYDDSVVYGRRHGAWDVVSTSSEGSGGYTAPGTIFPYASSTPPTGAFACNGQFLSSCSSLYPEFWSWLTKGQTNGTIRCLSNTEYEQELQDYGICAAFVIGGSGDCSEILADDSSNDSTSVRLPTLNNAFIEGATYNTNGGSDDIGTSLAPGLPNITGQVKAWGVEPYVASNKWNTGAFSKGSTFYVGGSNGHSSDLQNGYVFNFDASDSNNIYGSSSTVQPLAVKYIWCIQVFNSASGKSSKDLMEWVAKADATLAEVSSTGIKMSVNLGNLAHSNGNYALFTKIDTTTNTRYTRDLVVEQRYNEVLSLTATITGGVSPLAGNYIPVENLTGYNRQWTLTSGSMTYIIKKDNVIFTNYGKSTQTATHKGWGIFKEGTDLPIAYSKSYVKVSASDSTLTEANPWNISAWVYNDTALLKSVTYLTDVKQWYRWYASGWVEQGGSIAGQQISRSSNVVVTFPITMSDTTYAVQMAPTDLKASGDYYAGGVVTGSKGVTGFTYRPSGAGANGGFDWIVCGIANTKPSAYTSDPSSTTTYASGVQLVIATNDYRWYTRDTANDKGSAYAFSCVDTTKIDTTTHTVGIVAASKLFYLTSRPTDQTNGKSVWSDGSTTLYSALQCPVVNGKLTNGSSVCYVDMLQTKALPGSTALQITANIKVEGTTVSAFYNRDESADSGSAYAFTTLATTVGDYKTVYCKYVSPAYDPTTEKGDALYSSADMSEAVGTVAGTTYDPVQTTIPSTIYCANSVPQTGKNADKFYTDYSMTRELSYTVGSVETYTVEE